MPYQAIEYKTYNYFLLRNPPIQQPNHNKKDLPKPIDVQGWAEQAMRDGDWLEAARRWAILRAAYPNVPAHWIQGGVALMRAGEYTNAEDLLNLAKKKFKSNPNLLLKLSERAILQQDLGVAEQHLREARELFPESCAVWLKCAEFEIQKGEFEQAKKYSDRAKNQWECLNSQYPDAGEEFDAIFLKESAVEQPEQTESPVLTPKKPLRPFGPKHLTQLIWTKTMFNLRSEVHHNYLSYLWWIIEPTLHMLVYYVVFSFLLPLGGENYTVFLLTGLIPWLWFSKSVSSSSNTIIEGRGLMLQTGVPSIYFPLVKLLQTTIKQIPVFILLLIFIWIQGNKPDANWLALVPLLVLQVLIITTVALAISAAIPFVRDVAYLVPTGLAFLFFLSGIFYPLDRIPPEWQGIFLLNPVAYLLNCYREILFYQITPNITTMFEWGILTSLFCLVLLFIHKRLSPVFPRVVAE